MRLTETQQAIRDTVAAFSRDRIAPNAIQWEADGRYPVELFTELAQLGLMGMTAPEAFGGTEADYVSYALALMEIAAGDGGLSTVISVHNAPAIACLLQSGSQAQKERFLPDMCAGRSIGAFALTETDAGSDASAIRTRAERSGSGYVLNGTKQFITSGRIGGVAIVFAVTNVEAGKRGLSAFVVPTDTAGFEVDKVEHKLGQRASDTCALRFVDMAVGEDQLLGREGDGYKIALANLETGRIGIAAQSVGMARAALEKAVVYARERRSFGKAIIEHQAVGFRLADLAARLAAAEALVLAAAARKDAGERCLSEASMAKLFASETAEAVCSGALQTLGGYGYLEEFGIAIIYRDVRVCQIHEGTSDILRMVIARGLRADR